MNKIFDLIHKEEQRQNNTLVMIASENYVSREVRVASGSVLTNKYAEGYAGARYYSGCEYVDEIEKLAIEGAKRIFGCQYANVQSHSGSSANFSIFGALLSPGDTILGMDLSSGGHLTHGSKASLSGRWFTPIQYGLDHNDLIDYNQVRDLALSHRPKLIICGASSYTRQIDFQKFKEIASEVGAYLLADVSHYSGLIVGGCYPNPFPYADVVMTTTHKTLRGPRGGLILCNDDKIARKIDTAIFPRTQGGPMMNTIAAKAIAFEEAALPSFREYAHAVVESARILASALTQNGIKIVGASTDCHMVVVDLQPLGISGSDLERSLLDIGISCNKNAVPNDPLPPSQTSGIRLGTAALCTRGMPLSSFSEIGQIIAQVIERAAKGQSIDNRDLKERVNYKLSGLKDIRTLSYLQTIEDLISAIA